jgi:hypothetical protein
VRGEVGEGERAGAGHIAVQSLSHCRYLATRRRARKLRDWAADHGVAFEVAEQCLAHKVRKLPDLMVTLTNCDKARSVSIHDRCKAVYEGL